MPEQRKKQKMVKGNQQNRDVVDKNKRVVPASESEQEPSKSDFSEDEQYAPKKAPKILSSICNNIGISYEAVNWWIYITLVFTYMIYFFWSYCLIPDSAVQFLAVGAGNGIEHLTPYGVYAMFILFMVFMNTIPSKLKFPLINHFVLLCLSLFFIYGLCSTYRLHKFADQIMAEKNELNGEYVYAKTITETTTPQVIMKQIAVGPGQTEAQAVEEFQREMREASEGDDVPMTRMESFFYRLAENYQNVKKGGFFSVDPHYDPEASLPDARENGRRIRNSRDEEVEIDIVEIPTFTQNLITNLKLDQKFGKSTESLQISVNHFSTMVPLMYHMMVVSLFHLGEYIAYASSVLAYRAEFGIFLFRPVPYFLYTIALLVSLVEYFLLDFGNALQIYTVLFRDSILISLFGGPSGVYLSVIIPFALKSFFCFVCCFALGIRFRAISQAGGNFTHVVAGEKRPDHELVTTGIYSTWRHPGYLGWTVWALSSQLCLGTPISFFLYLAVCQMFFSTRIEEEEKLLVKFFGLRYIKYISEVPTGLPKMFGEVCSQEYAKSILERARQQHSQKVEEEKKKMEDNSTAEVRQRNVGK